MVTISNNLVHDNGTGITASSNVLVVGNSVYAQTGTNNVGINVTGNAEALQRLFESHGRLYAGPVDSLRDVLQDTRDHEQALAAGVVSELAADSDAAKLRAAELAMQIAAMAPLKRNTEPAEVADAAVFLASELGRGTTFTIFLLRVPAPAIEETAGKQSKVMTYQDLLRNENDELLIFITPRIVKS